MKILTEVAVTMEARSLFKYFTPLTAKDDPLFPTAAALTLHCLVKVASASGWKRNMIEPKSKRIIRSAQHRHHFKAVGTAAAFSLCSDHDEGHLTENSLEAIEYK